MPNHPHKDLPLKKAQIDTTEFKKQLVTRPGSRRTPARAVVKTDAERLRLVAECEDNGWTHDITVDADQDEYLNEIEFLRNRPETVVLEAQPGRNDPCHCGSGKKFKKCCSA